MINDQNEDKLSSESRFSAESHRYDLNLAHYLAFIKFMRIYVNFIVIPLVNPRLQDDRRLLPAHICKRKFNDAGREIYVANFSLFSFQIENIN